MELVHGISTHFIQSKSLKRTKSPCVLPAPLSLDTIAGRMLSASMLETANQMYPFSRFEKTFGQSIRYRYVNQLFQKRQSHIVELTFAYVRDEF